MSSSRCGLLAARFGTGTLDQSPDPFAQRGRRPDVEPAERVDCQNLLREVATSPILAHALAQQVLAVDTVRRLDVRAPAALRERIRRLIRQACAEAHRP